VLLTKVPDPQAFGVAILDGERIAGFVEKPKDPPSDLALTGVYLFDANIFESAKAIEPSFRDELEITDAIQHMIDRGLEVRPHIHTGWWLDTGKKDDMLEANRILLETMDRSIEGDVDAASTIDGRVVIDPGAKIERSTIRGPAIIGPGAEIIDSYVGPNTAIGENCKVTSSEIEHSILLAGSKVTNVGRVTDSIFGRDAEVVRDTGTPRAYRLLIGDTSSVSVV
jgi:glucose-1-phosphate thymidylyltransferase